MQRHKAQGKTARVLLVAAVPVLGIAIGCKLASTQNAGPSAEMGHAQSSSPTATPLSSDHAVAARGNEADDWRRIRTSPQRIERKRSKLAAKQSTNPAPRMENPSDRFREWYDDRAGEDGVFTFDQVLRAKEQAEGMPELAVADEGGLRDAGIWQWQWMGPNNIGGRIRAISVNPIDPDEILVGAASGGIWISRNGGQSWTAVDDFLPSLSIGCMFRHPSIPDLVYAGTGESFANDPSRGPPGAGVFRSTDGGATWSQIPSTADWQYVNRIAVRNWTPEDILLAATETGLYRSIDDGENWDRVLSPDVVDVKWSPIFSNRAIAAGDNGNAWYSADFGDTWQDVSFFGAPGVAQVAAAFTADEDFDDDTIAVTLAEDFSRNDTVEIGFGDTQDVRLVTGVDVEAGTITVRDLQYDHAAGENILSRPAGRVELAYTVADASTVYASMDVGGGTIWRSTDGGETFFIRSNTTDNYLKRQGQYDNAIWVAPNNSDLVVVGGIQLWRSTDGGQSLTRIGGGVGFEFGTDAHVDQHVIIEHPEYTVGNERIYVGNDGGIQENGNVLTAAIGTGWTSLSANGLGNTQFYGGAASPDGRYVIGGTQDNDTVHLGPIGWYFGEFLTDGGRCAIDYRDPDNPVFFKEAQYLGFKRSFDLGETYEIADNGLIRGSENARFVAPFRKSPTNPQTLVAGGTSIFRTTDGGTQWTSIRDPLDNEPKCSAVAIAESVDNRIWVGFENGVVSRTNATVSDFTDLDDGPDPLPNRTVTDILIHPTDENIVFVTFGGYAPDNVWYTTDNGATWEPRTGSGEHLLPDIHVSSIVFHPVTAEWIYVGTDLGVFASEDRGQTWSRTPRYPELGTEGPVNVSVNELFWQGSDYLYAATMGRGMYRVRPLFVVHVDGTYAGPEEGTSSRPFNTVTEGIEAIGPGAAMLIKAGTYSEGPLRFEKRGRVVANEGSVHIR